jgi:hypothetical protein
MPTRTEPVNLGVTIVSRAAIEAELLARINSLECRRCSARRDVTHDELEHLISIADLSVLTLEEKCSVDYNGRHWLVAYIVADQPLFGVPVADDAAHYVGTTWKYEVDRDLVEALERAR